MVQRLDIYWQDIVAEEKEKIMSKKPTIADLQQQITELTDALQRERADVTNIRRQHDQQMGSLQTMVKTSVVRDLLPVIDNCERLLRHVSKAAKDDAWEKGVEQIAKQMEKTLADLGVERIKTVGEIFDPNLHEAVGVDESVAGSKEVVAEELQSGYRLGNEVIRHAMVKVKMEAAK